LCHVSFETIGKDYPVSKDMIDTNLLTTYTMPGLDTKLPADCLPTWVKGDVRRRSAAWHGRIAGGHGVMCRWNLKTYWGWTVKVASSLGVTLVSTDAGNTWSGLRFRRVSLCVI